MTATALFRRARIMLEMTVGEEIGYHPLFPHRRRKSGKYSKVNFFALEALESLDGGMVLVNPAANCIPSYMMRPHGTSLAEFRTRT